MSLFRRDDEFFSPVRFDISAVDEISENSDESLIDFQDAKELSATNLSKSKIKLDENVMVSVEKIELKSKDDGNTNSESKNKYTPIFKNNGSDKSIEKRQSSKLKLEKIKKNEIVAEIKGNIKSQLKKQISPHRVDILEPHPQKSDAFDKHHQESKSVSLSSENKNKKHDSIKDIKMRQKGNKVSSKCDYIDEVKKSNIQPSGENISTYEASNLSEHSCDVKCKDTSVMSTLSKETKSMNISKGKQSNFVHLQTEKSTVNPINSSYETSVEKMIRSSISSESAKVRQHMYTQQMCFYREINKLKDAIGKQHLVTTERLFKVIEELMQMNASLRLAQSSKD